MSTPLQKDHLDDPIADFVQAIDEFQSMNLNFEVPAAPTGTPNGGWDELKRVWEESKQALRKMHTAFVGVRPQINAGLQAVAEKGSIVLGLTDDPFIVGPVSDLIQLIAGVGSDIRKLESALGKAASIFGFVGLVLEMVGINERLEPTSVKIAAQRDALIAYNLMRERRDTA